MIQRFEREARAAAQLQGRHVTRVSDVDTLPDGRPFMVMEYLEGHDLDDELARHHHVDVTEAVDYMLQTCTAMAEAHALGIVHRDLKPHNLFLTIRDGEPCIKVLDFGISKIMDEIGPSVTQTASALGTPLYMSPEQIRSAKHVDARSDIWSLGVILYELISGETPFDGESATAVVAAITADTPRPLEQVVPEVPPGLSAAVMKCLEKKPDQRYPDVATFAEAIAPYGSSQRWLAPGEFSRPSLQRISDMSTDPTLVARARDVALTARSWETGSVAQRRRWSSRTLVVTLAVLTVGVIAALSFFARDAEETGEPTVSATTVQPAPVPMVESSAEPTSASATASVAGVEPSATAATSASADANAPIGTRRSPPAPRAAPRPAPRPAPAKPQPGTKPVPTQAENPLTL
jgi:serine/threonine-protein kinase